MATDGFSAFAKWIFAVEGGVNPNDEGSESVFGVRRVNHPEEPWPPTKERAEAIYRAEYWHLYGCDRLPTWLGIAVGDWLVNGGPAIRTLQDCLDVTMDGAVGPETVGAAGRQRPDVFLPIYLARRGCYMASLDSFEHNGREWISRLIRLDRECCMVAMIP